MKIIRFLLTCLALAAALIVVLAAAAFVPFVQTWVAQMALSEYPSLHGSLGSLSVGLGQVALTDLHLDAQNAELTLPSVRVELPVKVAALDRKILIHRIVAKGWTLDLRRRPDAVGSLPPLAPAAAAAALGTPSPTDETAPVPKAASVFRSILRNWALPLNLSLDGVDLEGDVLLPGPPGKDAVRVRLKIAGGGLSAGREGDFTIDAAGVITDSDTPINSVAAHGSLLAALDSARIFRRIEFKADLTAQGSALPGGLSLSADFAASRGTGEENYAIDLSRGARHLALARLRCPETGHRLTGTWQVDLRDSDLAPWAVGHPLPSFTAAGNGRFEDDPGSTGAGGSGRLRTVASHLGALAPSWERLGTVAADISFAGAQTGSALRVDRLSVALDAGKPIASIRSLQPFAFDWANGDVKPGNAAGDWLGVSIQALPLAWLPGLTDSVAFAGGDAAGEYVVRAGLGTFTVRPTKPLTATGVSVRSGGKTLLRGLDLSLSLSADCAYPGWEVRSAALRVDSGSRLLATAEGKLSRPAATDQPATFSGTWNANLETLAANPGMAGIGWIQGKSASGDFSGTAGAPTTVEGKLTVVGHDPRHSLAASVNADLDADGTIAFLTPVKIAFGPEVSDLSADGSWARDAGGTQVDVKLTGASVILAQLRLLAAPMAAIGGVTLPAGSTPIAGGNAAASGARDRIPFWGDLAGKVTVEFDRLKAGDHEFNDVAGVFAADHAGLRLTDGRGRIALHSLAKVEGSVSFDPSAAEFPYRLKGAIGFNEVNAATWFPAPKGSDDPVIEGRFTLACTLTGSGRNLDDLIGRSEEEFRLASTGGIVRVLKTASVADSIPEGSTPIADTLGTVGSLVGSFFGVKGDSAKSAQKPLTKNADAVLEFTNQIAEIGYSEIALTAIRASDGTIRLEGISMTAPEEHLTGSGRIGHVAGRSLRSEPLSVDLQFGARGRVAELLSATDLLSARKDSLGYTLLNPPVHFGGTLEHIDQEQWHAVLIKAATQKPPTAKKGG